MTAVVLVQGLKKRFGHTDALAGVDLELAPGEIVGLLGPNGAGKTTLLRTLVGLVRPDAGSVHINGVDLAVDAIRAKAQIGYVGHERNLMSLLTVTEQLELSAQLYRGRFLETEREELLDALGLTEKADVTIGALSEGLKQRVSIACALLHRPTLLLLDEPMFNLDPSAAWSVRVLLQQRAKEGAAVLISSHLLREVESLCTRFVLLSDGHRLASGTLDELRGQVRRAGADLEEVFFQVAARHRPEEVAS